MMNTLELFAGTRSFSKVASALGHSTFTSDISDFPGIDYPVDVMDFDTDRVDGSVDLLWASPPCETFSVASIGHHWGGGKRAYIPKTREAIDGIERVLKTLEIIEELKPRYWIIENPRGVLRKMYFMKWFRRHTVTYCQYGDDRMKPTDIWTNIPDLKLKPMCRNLRPGLLDDMTVTLPGFEDVADRCHEIAPRGSRTGTQGIGTYKDRSRVPAELCDSILRQVEVMI